MLRRTDSNVSRALLALLSVLLCATATVAQEDLKMERTTDLKIPGIDLSKMPNSPLNISHVTTIFVKGSRLRSDGEIPRIVFPGTVGKKRISRIQQCDLKRTVQLYPKQKVYTIRGAGEESAKDGDKKGGYQDVTIDVTDTGERKDMFGFAAKHLKSRTTFTPGGDACSKMPVTIEGDGWYVELPTFACEVETDRTFDSMQQTAKGCADEVRVKTGGTMHLGFALQETKTFSAKGQSFQIIENVISLERANLDASLFEIPPDYKATKSSPADDDAVAASPAPADSAPANSANQDWTKRALPEMAPLPSEMPVRPKRPGVIRVGVVLPATDLGDALEPMKPGVVIQNELLQDLKSDTVEAVPINAGVQVQQEAKRKECDYLLYSEARKKFNSPGMPKGQMAAEVAMGMAASALPFGNLISSMIERMTLKQITQVVQPKEEIGFSYRLTALDGSEAIPQVATSQKAKKPGDDIITPQVRDAVGKVMSAVGRKK